MIVVPVVEIVQTAVYLFRRRSSTPLPLK